MDLRGTVAFVTGGASGIGLAIAEALLAEGCHVAVADVDARRIAELRRNTSPDRPGLIGVYLDVANPASWQAAKVQVEAELGPVELLVNNAGIASDGYALADMSIASFERLLHINLFGVFYGIATFASGMRDRGRGHILNTASAAGMTAAPGIGAYNAAKFGVVGLSEALREELAAHDVGVSILCPGLVHTRLNETTLAAGSERKNLANDLFAAGINPDEVARLALAGIRANEPFIFTHPDTLDRIEARHAIVRAAFARPDRP